MATAATIRNPALDWLSAALPASGTLSLVSGEQLFRAGEPVSKLYVVEHGAIYLERPLSHGDALIIHRCSAGEWIAEASLFAPHYHCSAVAEQDAKLRVYERTAVQRLLVGQPALAEQLCRLLCSEVQALRTQLELAHIKSANERTLTWLRLHAAAGEVAIERPLKSIAAELGLAHETFYRTLRELARQGLIRREQGRILLV